MRALSINFAEVRNPWHYLTYLLLLTALLWCAQVTQTYVQHTNELAVWTKSWRDLKKLRPITNTAATENQPQLQAELAAAQQTISSLRLPWDALFLAIESSTTEHIALLSIEPEVKRRQVKITAESKDIAGMLSYIRQLHTIAALQDAHVLQHQVQVHDPQRPLRFVVVATWPTVATDANANQEVR